MSVQNVQQPIKRVDPKGGSYAHILMVLSDPQQGVRQKVAAASAPIKMQVQLERAATQLLKQATMMDQDYSALKNEALADIHDDISRIENSLTRENYDQSPISAEDKQYAGKLSQEVETSFAEWKKLQTETKTTVQSLLHSMKKTKPTAASFSESKEKFRSLREKIAGKTPEVQNLQQDLMHFNEKTKAARIRMNIPAPLRKLSGTR